MKRTAFLAPLLLATATAAHAEELRPFCGDRPGLGTAGCTVDPGHLQVETSLGDYTRDTQPDMRTDTFLANDMVLRYGLTKDLEARIGWTTFGHVRERDAETGDVMHATRTGDVTLGVKRNIKRSHGHGFTIALLPFVSLPVGRRPVGAGDWGAGMLVPITYTVSKALQFEFTPELEAAVDEDGHGRHTAFSGVVGVQVNPIDPVKLTAEYKALRDRDPSGHETQQFAGLSVAWLAKKQLQFDVGSNIGLNRAAPDVEIYVGVAHKF